MRKLKVIQILPTLNTGGVERGVLDFNKYLVKNGHDSFVISNGGRQVKNLIEDGGNHIHLQISKKSIFTLFQAKKLADVINEVAILAKIKKYAVRFEIESGNSNI